MKAVHLYVILAIVLVVGMVGAQYLYGTYKVLEYKEIEVTYEVVEDSIGFDTTIDKLAFGRVSVGGKSLRSIELVSAEPAVFYIGITGDALGYLRPEPSEGVLEPEVPQRVQFTLYAPAETGNFTGMVQVRVLRR